MTPRCVQAIVSEASALAQQLEERARESLIGLNGLLDALQQYPGRKTVVVVSGGMARERSTRRSHRHRRRGRRPRRTSRTRQRGHLLRSTSTPACRVPTRRRPAGSATCAHSHESGPCRRSCSMNSRSASGGALLPVNVGAGDIALSRVLRETSAYYLLGVEPNPADRDGKAHRLRVRVDQRGATIRSRQWVVLPKAGG